MKKTFLYTAAIILVLSAHSFVAHADYDCSSINSSTDYYTCCTDTGGGSEQDCLDYENQYMSSTSASAGSSSANACSATNINSDTCYEENCTGQSSEDSTSCGSYALSVVQRDDGGNTACKDITDSNEASCCPASDNNPSPMCVAFENYSGDAPAGSKTAAIIANLKTAAGALNGSPSTATAAGALNGTSANAPLNIHLQNPLSGVSTIPDAINKILTVVIRIALPLIILFFIWSGFSFITARGNPKKIEEARNIFLYTVIGTLLILGAWVISNAIIGTVSSIIN